MSKLYKLTKQTHELVEKLAKQEGVEVKLMNVWWVSDCGIRHCIDQNTGDLQELSRSDYQPLLEAPQIRQILRAFEGILGVNPKFKEDRYESYCDNIHGMWGHFEREVTFVGQAKTQAEALCQRWLDGLNPMIDSELEKVLEELNEALQSKLT